MKSFGEVYREWKKLVNMDTKSLSKFIKTHCGKEAGLSRAEASSLGIRSGRDSARAILRMRKKTISEWNDNDWTWALHQIAFIKRMSRNKGDLIKDGEITRKYMSLLIWGHDPLYGKKRNWEHYCA